MKRERAWRAVFNATAMIPGTQWRHDTIVMTRPPNVGQSGDTPEVEIWWCGTHVELCGPMGIVIIPAHAVTQVDIERETLPKDLPIVASKARATA